MSKLTETIDPVIETDNDVKISPVDVSTKELESVRKQLAQLEEMEPGVSLDPRYFKFESVGQSIRGVFLGYKNITVADKKTGEDKEMLSIVWMDKDENVMLNCGVSLVNTVRNADLPQLTPIQITYTGSKATKGGSVNLYDVRILQ